MRLDRALLLRFLCRAMAALSADLVPLSLPRDTSMGWMRRISEGRGSVPNMSGTLLSFSLFPSSIFFDEEEFVALFFSSNWRAEANMEEIPSHSKKEY